MSVKNISLRFSNTNKTPTASLVVPPGIENNYTSLTFIGEGSVDYNGSQQQNFLSLLEHFASDVEPLKAIEGQLWYDINTNELKVAKILTPYIAGQPPSIENPLGVAEQPETLQWINPGAPIFSEVSPNDPSVLWYNTTPGTEELYVHDGIQFSRAALNVLLLTGGMLSGPLSVAGTLTAQTLRTEASSVPTFNNTVTVAGPWMFRENTTLQSGSNTLTSNNSSNVMTINTAGDQHFVTDSDNNQNSTWKVSYGTVSPTQLFSVTSTEATASNLNEINTNGNELLNIGVPSMTPTSTDAAQLQQLLNVQTSSVVNLALRAGDTFTGALTVPPKVELKTSYATNTSPKGAQGILIGDGVGTKPCHIKTTTQTAARLLFINEQSLASQANPLVNGYSSVKLDLSEQRRIYLQPTRALVQNVADPDDTYDATNRQSVLTMKSNLQTTINGIKNGIYGPKAWVEVTGGTYRAYNAVVTFLSTGLYRVDINTSNLFPNPSNTNKVGIIVGSLMGNVGGSNTSTFEVINSSVTMVNATRFQLEVAKMGTGYTSSGWDDCASQMFFTKTAFGKNVNILIFWE